MKPLQGEFSSYLNRNYFRAFLPARELWPEDILCLQLAQTFQDSSSGWFSARGELNWRAA